MKKKFSIVVLISGNGSNLQAIIDAKLNLQISAVISNNPDAYGLQRAQEAKLPSHVIAEPIIDDELIRIVDAYAPDLIVLAGFMRKLSDNIVARYSGKMINLHPSLLPLYRGTIKTHQLALSEKMARHGTSIHFVNAELDAGPVISQASLAIEADDTKSSLKARVQELEYRLLPQTLTWFIEGRIELRNNQVFLDGEPAPASGIMLIH